MDLIELKGVSYQKKKLLEKLNIFTISDLISYFPRKYKDFTRFGKLEDAFFEESDEIVVQAKVLGIEKIKSKNNKYFLKIKIQDETANGYLIAFNQDYLSQSLKINEQYIVIGKFSYSYGEIQASQFQIEKKKEKTLHYGRIVPFYSLTEGITQKFLREIIYQALEKYTVGIKENLPQKIIRKHNLLSRYEALWNIHFPENFEKLKQAQKRIKYFELFKLQFHLALKKFFFQKKKNRTYLHRHLTEQFLQILPFTLTEGQKKALSEIENDLLSENPMHRLLQGDVGAGKTLVALITMLRAIENGYQAALMVPTEVLANQHFLKIKELLSPFSLSIGLLHSNIKGKERQEVIEGLKNGSLSLVIGTHALFNEEITFKNLAIVVIDEQHKFGVLQRASLIAKGENPDILAMTATPIPRTLGITVFGDMDISIIPDKPAGRKKIMTDWFSEKKLKEVFLFVDDLIEKGFQGYVVYPLIEDSEKVDWKSALTMFEEIKNHYLPKRRIGLIHGRMNEMEKQEVMQKFVTKEIDVLVSTTVIEVGVDVKDATFIIIENAHRFGLSTLHQLRGRVGRNSYQSYCYLITPENLNPEGRERMKAMKEIDDGFILSQKDLEIRGTGEFLGTNQKGLSELKLASLIEDSSLLESARNDAFEIVKNDPNLEKTENQIFKPWYDDFCKKYHLLLRT